MMTILLGAGVATWFVVWWLNSSIGDHSVPSSWEAMRRHLAEHEHVMKAETERLRLLENDLRRLASHPPPSPFLPTAEASEHDEVEALRRENARLEEANRDLRAALPMDDYRTVKDRRGGS